MVNASKAPSNTSGETAPLVVWKMGKIHLNVTVNGQARGIAVEPGTTLLEALRDGLGLTGTKKGCDRGECGACTVHV
ncbi:MAG TPA: 2Fe-2S iron-sulfur cluster-binding protein, partial [Acetobacteraceae bacterium]